MLHLRKHELGSEYRSQHKAAVDATAGAFPGAWGRGLLLKEDIIPEQSDRRFSGSRRAFRRLRRCWGLR